MELSGLWLQTQRAYNYSCLEDNKSSIFMQFRCAVYIAWLGALTNYKLRWQCTWIIDSYFLPAETFCSNFHGFALHSRLVNLANTKGGVLIFSIGTYIFSMNFIRQWTLVYPTQNQFWCKTAKYVRYNWLTRIRRLVQTLARKKYNIAR